MDGNEQTSGGTPPQSPEPGEAPTSPPSAPPAEAVAEAQPAVEQPAVGEARAEGEQGADEASAPEPPVVHKHFVAPALIPLDRVDAEDVFRLRAAEELEDVSALATDIARLGQLFPVDVRLRPPDRFQLITGFRRVAALRFLQRDKVLARLHTDLSDDDALLMALASAIHNRAVSAAALSLVQERLSSAGLLSPAARDMLEKALSTELALAPEHVDEGAAADEASDEEADGADEEQEVDPDEFAADVARRLSECNQDLSQLMEVFEELSDEARDEVITQLRYSVDLVSYLEGKR